MKDYIVPLTLVFIAMFGMLLFRLGNSFMKSGRAPLLVLDKFLKEGAKIDEIQHSFLFIGAGVCFKEKRGNVLYYKSIGSAGECVERVEIYPTSGNTIKLVVSDGKVSMLWHSASIMVFNPELSEEEDAVISSFFNRVRALAEEFWKSNRDHPELAKTA